MKEIEAFAKALSLGMKALAKMIETAADQLEEQLQAKPGTEAQPSADPGEKVAKQARGKQTAPRKSAPESAAGEVAGVPTDAGGPAPKAKKPARKKPPGKKNKVGKPSETEMVYLQIQSAEEPIHLDEIHRLTGFEKRKLHNILHRLKRSGRIRSIDKAVYAAN